MGEALTIEARHERGYPIVTVAGEIDIATATRLRERLSGLAARGRPLVADLDRVSFIDSAGLAALVGAAKRAAAHGGSLHVVCAQPKVRQLFRLTGRCTPATVGPHPGRGPGRLDGGPEHTPLAGRRTARTAGPGPGGRGPRGHGIEHLAPDYRPSNGPDQAPSPIKIILLPVSAVPWLPPRSAWKAQISYTARTTRRPPLPVSLNTSGAPVPEQPPCARVPSRRPGSKGQPGVGVPFDQVQGAGHGRWVALLKRTMLPGACDVRRYRANCTWPAQTSAGRCHRLPLSVTVSRPHDGPGPAPPPR